MFTTNVAKIISLTLTGWALSVSARSVDSLSVADDLREVTVSAITPRRVLQLDADGSIGINSAMLGEQASFMGANDPITLIRTLPSVRTSNDLQASLSVRGSGTGANLFLVDGVRVINPMHILGLYSAFNSAFYNNFTFRAGRIPATMQSVTAGVVEADSGLSPDSIFSGLISVGLIESHGAISVPIGSNASFSVGGRTTYLNTVFPRLLTLGSSHIKYSFTDLNASLKVRINSDNTLRISAFADGDKMSLLNDNDGSQDGLFSWKNFVVGGTWNHRDILTTVGVSSYTNQFEMFQGGRHINLPAALTQVSAQTAVPLGCFTFAADVQYRHSSGQNEYGNADVGEAAISALWHRQIFSHLDLNVGLRLSGYHNGNYNVFLPLPRIDLNYRLGMCNIFAAYGRYARFDRLVEESANGLPADFWCSATETMRPEESNSFELGLTGKVPPTSITFVIEGYYRKLLHNGEFTGSLLDLVNASYNPLDNLILGNGYSCGVSVTAMRQIGRVRGRVSYNYGVTRLRFDKYGDKMFPSSHDRPHDLNVSLNWSVWRELSVGAAYTYATGTPYTQAKYGYMIGENLICEYFPHNSSRLPSYKRLDFSATYSFAKHHSINISVYNALANHNVLMCFTRYSISEGINKMQSEMKSVIPSISYIYKF